ncbi:SsgA family sporulation/cell division regulator [Streptomyces sp. FH025]|uniref:SsgA family sporulation/cell division regulator n=1 Tax=Streptomyces sp. FH025 TaxID=2815937 RepID=UPI001A9EBA2F|nr:SsgA family sporulation/cell division regulator [Streptomyces sp. FH025]MBO1413754.1 SsgA family sporulation/cell division regulator [Streptomyces sp. FH025]
MPEDEPVLTLALKRLLDGHAWQPLLAEFRFAPDTPAIVTVTLEPTPGQGVTWRISRELLYQGLFEESGEGFVQAWPAPGRAGGTVLLQLESAESSALLELPAPRLAEWLERTYEIVPVEAEADGLDWDGFISELLGETGRPTGG